MKFANNDKPLTSLEIFKYTIPLPLRVRSRQLDTHIRQEIAEASIVSSLIMATVAIFVGLILYFLVINENEKYGDIWIGLTSLTYILIIFAHLYVKKQKRLNRLTVYKAYLAFFAPTTFSAFIWGTMPTLVVNQDSYIAMLCYVTSFLIIFGSSSWVIGLSWLSLYYACLAVLPLFSYVFWNSENQLSVLILALLFGFGTWITAHIFASGIIIGAAHKFKLMKQSVLIENLLNEFQVNSTDWVWETDEHHMIKSISIESEGTQIRVADRDFFNSNFTKLFDQVDPSVSALEKYFYRKEPFDQLILSFDPRLISGEKKAWALRGRPMFDDNKQFIGYRGFGRDITSIQKLNELNNSKDKFEMMSKFVAKIAHDFNNSLMVIQSSVEILDHAESETLSSESKEVLDTMKDVVNSASRVNKELLSFARQEVLCPTTVDLYCVFIDLTKKYKMRAPDVEFIVRPFKPSLVHTDQYALVRTLENLLMNSIEAMNYIGTITLTGTSIDWGKGSQIAFRVEDNGPGFTADALKSASEPFFTTKKQMGGSGLGLATAAGFVQQSGGEIRWGNSQIGAYIEIKLPASANNFTQLSSIKTIESANLRSKSVLIVDDDEKVLASLGRQLKDIFGEVVLANSIDAAIACANARPTKLDLILCDFQFENDHRHGVDLAEIVAYQTHHIIFMTGYSELSKELANYDVLPKPFSIQEFSQTYHTLTMRDSIGFRRQRLAT